MNFRKLIANATLPWILVGMMLVYFLLGLLGNAFSDCPQSGSYFVASPKAGHVAHRYYYACGGATVGFTQKVDVDGHTVFSTYGGGRDNVTLNWETENELHIVYSMELDKVQTHEAQYQDISIKFFRVSENGSPVTIEEISVARKAAGY